MFRLSSSQSDHFLFMASDYLFGIFKLFYEIINRIDKNDTYSEVGYSFK